MHNTSTSFGRIGRGVDHPRPELADLLGLRARAVVDDDVSSPESTSLLAIPPPIMPRPI